MLVIISPAKTLKTDIEPVANSSIPELIERSVEIVDILKGMTVEQLSKLMNISMKLAEINYERYQKWHFPYDIGEGNNAVFTFRGEVFNGLDIDSFTAEDLAYTNEHLRILSGLYGVLRPLDSILPYRLEMGTKLQVGKFKNLYKFWNDRITMVLNRQIQNTGSKVLVNLASEEYFKTVDTGKLKVPVITPVFKDRKGNNYKVISVYAKKARGLMTRFIMQNKISDPEELKFFDEDGYYYNEKLSIELNQLVFTRG